MFTDMVGYMTLFLADERVACDKRKPVVGGGRAASQRLRRTIVQRLGDGTMAALDGHVVAVISRPAPVVAFPSPILDGGHV